MRWFWPLIGFEISEPVSSCSDCDIAERSVGPAWEIVVELRDLRLRYHFWARWSFRFSRVVGHQHYSGSLNSSHPLPNLSSVQTFDPVEASQPSATFDLVHIGTHWRFLRDSSIFTRCVHLWIDACHSDCFGACQQSPMRRYLVWRCTRVCPCSHWSRHPTMVEA